MSAAAAPPPPTPATAPTSSGSRKRKARESDLTVGDDLVAKVATLCDLVLAARHAVIYTGAGISTACGLPDYRGPRGLWTLRDKGGKAGKKTLADITMALPPLRSLQPSYTHRAITALVAAGRVLHVVSQNCDGLHSRAGLSPAHLSEIHGNSFVELCTHCAPPVETLRGFDVTARSRLRRHGTGRHCPACGHELQDTIVHFGEMNGHAPATHNWNAALTHAAAADLIICLGSSLTVLKSYPLWGVPRARTPLVVVNLQPTCKDRQAAIAIHAPVDQVMAMVLARLGLVAPEYDPSADAVLALPDVVSVAEGEEEGNAENPGVSSATTARPGLGWLGRGKAGGGASA